MELFKNTVSGAEFSECFKYRYKLWRIWDENKPVAMCIGLNPSTANESTNDPTIRNLIKMLKKLGYGGFYMTNLYAWISSNPKDLLTVKDPLGENEDVLAEVAEQCDDIIACWGNFKEAEDRIEQVLEKYPRTLCFGINKNGTPAHPLAMMYQGKTETPELTPYKHK